MAATIPPSTIARISRRKTASGSRDTVPETKKSDMHGVGVRRIVCRRPELRLPQPRLAGCGHAEPILRRRLRRQRELLNKPLEDRGGPVPELELENLAAIDRGNARFVAKMRGARWLRRQPVVDREPDETTAGGSDSRCAAVGDLTYRLEAACNQACLEPVAGPRCP